ncbi:hypothetical protein PTI98_008335 [Pleurotus ostreatus]|nr:hypothetical protein PTI98_008335 [Pleurotus ostreatus]
MTNARRVNGRRSLGLAFISMVGRKGEMWVEEEEECGDGREMMDVPRIAPQVGNDDEDEEAEGVNSEAVDIRKEASGGDLEYGRARRRLTRADGTEEGSK